MYFYVLIYVCLLSLNTIVLRFIHIVVCICGLLILSPIGRHLHCCQFFAYAEQSLYEYSCTIFLRYKHSFLWEVYIAMELLYRRVGMYQTLLKPLKQQKQWCHFTVFVPSAMSRSSNYSTFCLLLFLDCLFIHFFLDMQNQEKGKYNPSKRLSWNSVQN